MPIDATKFSGWAEGLSPITWQPYDDEEDFAYIKQETLWIVDTYHQDGVNLVSYIVEHADVDLASDLLSIIGRSTDAETHDSIFELLVKHLAHDIPRMRHGAVKGLEHLNDKKAIPNLENALRVEEFDLLKNMMTNLVNKLKNKDI